MLLVGVCPLFTVVGEFFHGGCNCTILDSDQNQLGFSLASEKKIPSQVARSTAYNLVFHDVKSGRSRSGLPLSAFVGINYLMKYTF